jgi:hypothetical protein
MSLNNQVDPRKLPNVQANENSSSSCDLVSNADNKAKQKKLSKKCMEALDDLDTILNTTNKDAPRRLHKERKFGDGQGPDWDVNTISKGIRLRYYQLRKDFGNLYNTRRTGKNSYEGHKIQYTKMRVILNQIMKVVDGESSSSCKKEIQEWLKTLSPEMREKYEKLIEKGRKWGKQDPPKKPDQSLEDQQARGEAPNPKPAPAPSADPNLPPLSVPSINFDPLWWVLPVAGEMLRQLIPLAGQGASLPNQMQESNIFNQTKASNPKTEKTDKEVADIYLEGAKKARSENPNATLTESRSHAYKHVSKVLGSDYVRNHPDQLKKVDGAYVSTRSEILASKKASPTQHSSRGRELRL